MHPYSGLRHKIAPDWLRALAESYRRLAGAVAVAVVPDIAAGILPSPALAPAGMGDGRLCNTGGPRSRTRTEPIRSSIFAQGDGRLGARSVGEVHALFIGGEDSAPGRLGYRRFAHDALRECGFATPDAAFAALADLPRRRLHCRDEEPSFYGPQAKRPWENPEEFLKTALILGKCSHGLYDPSRPVIWTENRLGRWVRLYEIGEEFYAGTEE